MDKATEAVSVFFRSTRVGCLVALERPPEEEGDGGRDEEGGPAPL